MWLKHVLHPTTRAGGGTHVLAVARASEHTHALQLASRQRAYQLKLDGLHCYVPTVSAGA